MNFGDISIDVVSGGQFWMDGGNMFGVVPKTLWMQHCPADRDNRVKLDTNCVVVRNGDVIGIIDTGYGSKMSEKQRQRFGIESQHGLTLHLRNQGIAPEDVRWVILTHLHFDHVGGCTVRIGSELTPVFPRARHFIQRAEWEDANAKLPELVGSYFLDDWGPLESANLVEIVDGDAELFPKISVRLVGGHTRGHQLVLIESGTNTIAVLADLCPFVAHLKTFWSMSYDQFPLDVRRSKPAILSEAIDGQWLVIFGHDPCTTGARLGRDQKGQPIVSQTVELRSGQD